MGYLVSQGDPGTDSIDGQGTNLADLDPRSFDQARCFAFQSQRKSSTRFLAHERKRNDGAGSVVEDVVTQDQHRPSSRLFVAAGRVELGPAHFASQYSGHEAKSSASPCCRTHSEN